MITTFFRYFPVFALILNFFGLILNKRRYDQQLVQDPDLEKPYKKLLWGYLLVYSIPWLTMLVGIFLGNVPTMLHFFFIGSGDPFVISYWIILILLWLIGFVWIIFLGGAEFLLDYSWLFMNKRSRSKPLVNTPLGLKFLYSLGIIGIVVILLSFLNTDVDVISDVLSELP